MKPIPVLQLARVHRPVLRRHFLALPPDDLRLRFGRILCEAALLAYVDAIDFGCDGPPRTRHGQRPVRALCHLCAHSWYRPAVADAARLKKKAD